MNTSQNQKMQSSERSSRAGSEGVAFHLQVHCAGGELCYLTAAPNWTLKETKGGIESLTGIPMREQRLFHGLAELTAQKPFKKSRNCDNEGRILFDEIRPGLAVTVVLLLVRRLPQQAEWLERVEECPYWLRSAPLEARADPEVVMAAARRDPDTLAHAATELLANRDFLTASADLMPLGHPLRHAAPSLRDDRDFVMATVSQRGEALAHASKTLKADHGVVLAAVSQNGYALEHANESLQADRDIVLAAVANSGMALFYADRKFRADREVVLTAVARNGEVLEFVHPDLRADRGVVIAALADDGSALQFAAPELQAEREIVEVAVKQDSTAWQFARLRSRKIPNSHRTRVEGSSTVAQRRVRWADMEPTVCF